MKGLVTNLRIPQLHRVSERPVEPRVKGKGPYPPAATPEDAIAREAASLVEEQQGFRACAENRRRGVYDGDTEHQIALTAIILMRSNPPPSTVEQIL